MTTALAGLLLGVVGAALLLAVAAYLWVNRTPPVNERFDEYGRVPLFGVDRSNAPQPSAGMDELDAIEQDLHQDDEPMPAQRSVRTAEDVMADRPSPTGSPVAIDSSAVDAPALNTPNNNPSSFAPPAPLQSPEDVPRPVRTGWGATPGWPTSPDLGYSATPKYVPPVTPQILHARTAPPPTNGNGNGNALSPGGVPGSMIEGHQFRFSTPVEGTLQFLPGRLEVSSGLDTGRDIRFVRVPGPNGTEVTFGRNEGPLYRHIQLRDQTVSREHARLTFGEGYWTLTNLSRTNPVAHNGRVLRVDEQQPLSDGDRLEMGEVIFNFRSR